MPKRTRANSQIKSLARLRRRVTVKELLRASDVNTTLSEVADIPSLNRVIIIAESVDGTSIHYNAADVRAVILALDLMKSQLIAEFLYPDEEEAEW